MACLLQEFERATEKSESIDRRHYEQKSHAQIAFQKDVRSLTHAIKEMGNPFTEYSSDLLVLNSKDAVDTAVAETVGQILKIGLEQYESYVEKRLVNQTMPITDPINPLNAEIRKLTF